MELFENKLQTIRQNSQKYYKNSVILVQLHGIIIICVKRFSLFDEIIYGGGFGLAKVKTVPFTGTKKQEAELIEVINELKGEKGCLMPIMQKAQDIYGYLPYEVQKIIAEGLDIPVEKVYGVATFYSQFNLYPKGKYQISVCLGTACYVKGSGEIFNKLQSKLGIAGGECTPDGKFSLDACRCVGACGLAPVMMINDEVYGRLTPDMLDDILAKYN